MAKSVTYVKRARHASVRMAGKELTAMVRLFVPLAPLSLDSSLVCQTDNACANFPIRGNITSLDTTDSANMTCYKGGETLFNNHQFCDVTSMDIFISIL
jgi:hypothetical protein